MLVGGSPAASNPDVSTGVPRACVRAWLLLARGERAIGGGCLCEKEKGVSRDFELRALTVAGDGAGERCARG